MKTKDTKYQYVKAESRVNGPARVLCNVGILADGTLYNPNGYPEDLVRATVLAANKRQRQRRSEGAKKAASTRKARHEKKIYEVVQNLRLGHRYGPADYCVICHKELGDSESIERGIGSDCWQRVVKWLSGRQESQAAPK
jgi:hypothetical protein